MVDVGKNMERHLEIADNGFLFCRFHYLFDPITGEELDRTPIEFISIDPRVIEKVYDDTGAFNEDYKVCPEHRQQVHNKLETVCKTCGKKLKPVAYKTLMGKATNYYFADEVCHTPKYHANLVYGFPAIFLLDDEADTYMHMTRQTRNYYEKGRAKGFVTIPTNNLEQVRAEWTKTQEDMKKDPHKTPWLGFSPDTSAKVEFIKLMEDPSEAMLAVKKDLRDRMGSYFGVSPIFQSDTAQSGGLNNEGMQFTVTNRAIEFGQSLWNLKIFPFVTACFGITDWVLQVRPNEEADRMAEIEAFSKELDNAIKMQQIGYIPEYHERDQHKTFTFKGEASNSPEALAKQQPSLDMMGDPSQDPNSQGGDPDLEQFKADNPGLPVSDDGLIDFEGYDKQFQDQPRTGAPKAPVIGQ
jgi:hypothetical protein